MARIAPRPVVIAGAWDDEKLPRENVERLFAAAAGPRELIWTEDGHVHPQHTRLFTACWIS